MTEQIVTPDITMVYVRLDPSLCLDCNNLAGPIKLKPRLPF